MIIAVTIVYSGADQSSASLAFGSDNIMENEMYNVDNETIYDQIPYVHFPDDIFKWILLKENVSISMKIPLKFVPKGPIHNIPGLVKLLWLTMFDMSKIKTKSFLSPVKAQKFLRCLINIVTSQRSDKQMVSLLAHICVTRPQWVNNLGIILFYN